MNMDKDINKSLDKIDRNSKNKNTDELCKEVGRRIKRERKAQRLTLRNLSELADISVSFLGDIEKGRSNPSLPRLIEISQALGVPTYSFLKEEEMRPSEIAEMANSFGSLEDKHRKLLMQLTKDIDFLAILEAFSGYGDWTSREKAELLSLLRTKNEYR